MKFYYTRSIRTALIASIMMFMIATLVIKTRTSHAAADGDLDSTFGSGGLVTTDFFGRSNSANAIALQADGKIVVTGDALTASGPPDISVARYNSDGTLDSSFGSGGRVTTDFGRSDVGSAIVVQADGKIVVAGGADLGTTQFDFALVRYNTNGSLDTTFGSSGKVTTDFNGGLDSAAAIALQSDGKIVAAGFATAGTQHTALARYNTNGSLDTSFGSGGKVVLDFSGTRDSASALVIQPDGKMITGGFTIDPLTSFFVFALARYNGGDGSLDSTFGSSGKVTTRVVFGDGEDDEISGLALQADGRILAAGRANFAQDFGLVRYQPNGTLDTAFGTNGVVTTDFNGNTDRASSVVLQIDGKIILAGAANLTTGSTGDFGLARYNLNGSLDSTFGVGGKVITDFNSNVDQVRGIVIQADNKIVAAGSTFTVSTGDYALARYLATVQPSDVSGRILDTSGNPVEGVAIKMTGTQNRLAVTDSQGAYRFDSVTANGSYTLTPNRANYTFTPALRTFVQTGSHTDAPFTATFVAAGLNPIDTSEYFVRQHYLDFLSREPDESGFNFWVNQIESCGASASCRENKRINVSAAFFLSIEFQQTGYLVYRTYKTAYGNISGAPVPVRFNEFLPDTQQIGQGVIVGQTGWEATLENNKRTFMEAFSRRSRFQTAFPPGTPAAKYVDTLNANAGGVLSSAERDQLIADLISNAKTAGQVLRAVAEDQDLYNNEFNKAFVLMQYFGYLRRNPNDPPEQTLDFQGYNFWLGKLNQFNGNYQNADMVKAFITSSEYRGRFPK
jgi:uncharacterized delta-60 repeat protein